MNIAQCLSNEQQTYLRWFCSPCVKSHVLLEKKTQSRLPQWKRTHFILGCGFPLRNYVLKPLFGRAVVLRWLNLYKMCPVGSQWGNYPWKEPTQFSWGSLLSLLEKIVMKRASLAPTSDSNLMYETWCFTHVCYSNMSVPPAVRPSPGLSPGATFCYLQIYICCISL